MTILEPETSKRSSKLRAFFARYIAERGGVKDPRIEQAFRSVPRELFAGPPPWFIGGPLTFYPVIAQYTPTPDDDPAFLYQDVLIALDRARGINIGEPGFHAFCLDALGVRENDVVVHVGAGSGYYTAILGHLVGPQGRVHAFEIDVDLARRAKNNLTEYYHVDIGCRSGAHGQLPEADVIYVSAGCTGPSEDWFQSLKPGGRLMFPLQKERSLGGMLLVRRPLADAMFWPARFLTRAIFISCAGLQNVDQGERVAEAFEATGSWMDVKSLRFDNEIDSTCWCRGDGWWLSTSECR